MLIIQGVPVTSENIVSGVKIGKVNFGLTRVINNGREMRLLRCVNATFTGVGPCGNLGFDVRGRKLEEDWICNAGSAL